MYDFLAIASIPEAAFEAALAGEVRPTTGSLVRLARELPKRRRRRALTCCPHCGGLLE
jgi:hypothetical protein